MTIARAALLAALMSGCTTVSTPFTETFDATELYVVEGRLDNGDFNYNGAATTELAVDGLSWGHAASQGRAADRESQNRWTITPSPPALLLDTSSGASSAGVDLSITGPDLMDLDVISDSGLVTLQDVEGYQVVTADRITGSRLVGDVDLYARAGDLDVEVWPWVEGVVRVETESGGLDLYLPWGLEYDLQVWGDENYELVVEDLGFARSTAGVAYFAATTGFGTIRVDVYATGGPVRVMELR
ncbi:MAG: hypothetical protein H6739_41645 [Alphaproteobacteria bacterium]|nr:hypothetical protein [Alphaproteobacteria bacterium]